MIQHKTKMKIILNIYASYKVIIQLNIQLNLTNVRVDCNH